MKKSTNKKETEVAPAANNMKRGKTKDGRPAPWGYQIVNGRYYPVRLEK